MDSQAPLGGLVPHELPRLPARRAEAHKGDFGRLLLIGGSSGMAGSIAMSASAALRSGAGLVSLNVPQACADVVAGFNPCFMCHGVACDERGRLSLEALEQIMISASSVDCLAIGPGLGRSDPLRHVVTQLYKQLAQPAVFDADGLNALAQREVPLGAAGGPRVLTPHPGEFVRLSNRDDLTRQQQCELARELAKRHGVVIVLKGHHTFVSDGDRDYINPTGNPGMATGGSGDVLTGVIGALLGQGLAAWGAACLGTFVHGLAGDLAARRIGQLGMTPIDMIDELPTAFRSLED